MTLNEAISELDWHFIEYGDVSDQAAYDYLKSEFMKLKKIQARVHCPMRTSEDYCCMPMDTPCADIDDKVCNGLHKAYNSVRINTTITTTSGVQHG